MDFIGLSFKRIILVAALLSLFLVANAQKKNVFMHYQEVDSKKFHFGFSLGFNHMDYNFRFNNTPDIRADIISIKPGFFVGGIAEYRLCNDFALRTNPGLEFGSRAITFKKRDEIQEANYASILVDVPLLVKYKAKRINNARPYLVSGFGIKYDVQAKDKYEPESNMYIRTKPLDFYYQFGFGIDWYFPYFKWSTELRLAIGLSDLLNHTIDKKAPGYAPVVDDYTKSLNMINSKMVSLVFHFE